MPRESETEVLLTMKGTAALTILAAKNDNSPRAHQIFDEMCKQIALNRYGKPAAEIKASVLKMTDEEVMKWLAGIWGKYLNDDDIMRIWSLFADIKYIY